MSSSGEQAEGVQVRCILIGASAVGKSTFLKRLTANSSVNSLTTDYSMTSRVDVHHKSYDLPANNNRLQVEVCFLDTPGRQPYQALVEGVCKRTTAAGKCLIVALFDVSNRASLTPLEGLMGWLNKQQQQANNGKTATEGVLVANKIDLVDKRIVSPAEGQQKAKMFKLRYFECSALNDIAIQDFEQLILDMVQTMLIPPADIDKNGAVPVVSSVLKSID